MTKAYVLKVKLELFLNYMNVYKCINNSYTIVHFKQKAYFLKVNLQFLKINRCNSARDFHDFQTYSK